MKFFSPRHSLAVHARSTADQTLPFAGYLISRCPTVGASTRGKRKMYWKTMKLIYVAQEMEWNSKSCKYVYIIITYIWIHFEYSMYTYTLIIDGISQIIYWSIHTHLNIEVCTVETEKFSHCENILHHLTFTSWIYFRLWSFGLPTTTKKLDLGLSPLPVTVPY